MTTLQAFLLGIMVAYTPSLLWLAWVLRDVPINPSTRLESSGKRRA
jgi:hypothetical protein